MIDQIIIVGAQYITREEEFVFFVGPNPAPIKNANEALVWVREREPTELYTTDINGFFYEPSRPNWRDIVMLRQIESQPPGKTLLERLASHQARKPHVE